MKKKPIFGKIVLALYFLVLLVIAIFVVQIKLALTDTNKETLLQKILPSKPTVIKMHQKVAIKDNLEITFKDKNIADKISAPVSFYGYVTSHNADKNNTLIYFNTNVASLYKKKEALDRLIKAKVVAGQKYEFDCFTMKESEKRNDFVRNIYLMPFQRENVYFVCEIPKLFTKAKGEMVLDMEVDKQNYVLPIK